MDEINKNVTALIEVKIAPQKDDGYDRIAGRLSQYDEVESLYLMSGTNDLMVTVSAKTVQEVAVFVNEHVASIAGVMGTETHFMLKKYKEQGKSFIKNPVQEERIDFV